MSERQRGSENYSLPRDKRRRKPLNITLSEAAMAALDQLAEARGESRSQVIEAEVLRAHARLPK
jgi:Ribbon-helix-helix protein, copG family